MEWQSDQLAAAGPNAQLEGDDSGTAGFFQTVTPTTRLGNRCQISSKNCVISGTQNAVNTAGRRREIVYQLTKRNKEIRRDMEFVLIHNNNVVPNAGNSTTARVLRSLIQWYATNTSRGATGANGGAAAAVQDGTQRALTEALVTGQIQAAWTQGGEIDLIMCGPSNKVNISKFTGNVQRVQDTSDARLMTNIEIYRSDFGTHKVVANRFQRDREVHLLDTSLLALSSLRPLKTIDLAVTGDSEKG